MESKVNFPIGMGVRQECVISPWLFNICMNGCMRKIKVKLGTVDTRLIIN